MMRAAVLLVALGVLLGATAVSATPSETLLQAVGFALTAIDDAKIRVIDADDCVFGDGTKVYHLNNIDVDRIKIQDWVNKSAVSQENFTTVELHGESVVLEETTQTTREELKKKGWTDDMIEMVLKAQPRYLDPQFTSANETKLTLETTEGDRVRRAWQYIYAHGCKGKRSAF